MNRQRRNLSLLLIVAGLMMCSCVFILVKMRYSQNSVERENRKSFKERAADQVGTKETKSSNVKNTHEAEAVNEETKDEPDITAQKQEDIPELPALTEDVITKLINPLEGWIYIQAKSFKNLNESQKVEMCAAIALREGRVTSQNGYFVSEEVISDIMKIYFGKSVDLKQVSNTDIITVQEDGVSFIWGDVGMYTESRIISIDEAGKSMYRVSVEYYIKIGEQGSVYEYATVVYEFSYNNEAEDYYISDFNFNYCYPGDDYVNEEEQTKKEKIRDRVVEHYTALWKPSGKYISFDMDDSQEGNVYKFVLRYQMTKKEADERIEKGLMVALNKYITAVWVDMNTGEVTDEIDDQSWIIDLN